MLTAAIAPEQAPAPFGRGRIMEYPNPTWGTQHARSPQALPILKKDIGALVSAAHIVSDPFAPILAVPHLDESERTMLIPPGIIPLPFLKRIPRQSGRLTSVLGIRIDRYWRLCKVSG